MIEHGKNVDAYPDYNYTSSDQIYMSHAHPHEALYIKTVSHSHKKSNFQKNEACGLKAQGCV